MSQKYSMSGWSWREWLTRNKSALKTLLAGVMAALGALAGTVVLPEWAVPLPALFVGFLSRLALDAVDYWLNEQGE